MSLDGANELECMEYYSGSLVYSKLVHSTEFSQLKSLLFAWKDMLWVIPFLYLTILYHDNLHSLEMEWMVKKSFIVHGYPRLSQFALNCINCTGGLGTMIVNGDLQLIMLLVSISSLLSLLSLLKLYYFTINRSSCEMDLVAVTPYLLFCCYVVQTVLLRLFRFSIVYSSF